jgi:PAS domain S-box-containing protein
LTEVFVKDTDKTKEQLMKELTEIQRQLAQLKEAETDYKQAQLVVLENQALLAGVLDIASEAIISTDETQQIILFNKGAEKIFGYSSDEAIGQPLDILLPKRFMTVHQNYIADFDASAIPTRLMGERQEIWGYRKNGEEFPAEASISKLEVDDKKIFTVVLRDTTARKHVEQEREEHIVKLRSLNEATQAIAAELTWEQVLQKIVQAAQALIKVKYAALGMHDGQGNLSQFITAGIEAKDWAKIGPSPVGRGLLGVLFREGKSIIVKDIARHPSTFGFPEIHPPG